MNPSPQALAAIRAKVTDWTPDDATIAAGLNTANIANPVPQPTVPKPFSPADLVNAIDATRRPNIKQYLVGIAPAIAAQAGQAIRLWASGLVALGDLQQSDADAIGTVLSATEPDPSWPSQVSWAVATIGRAVDTTDVADARKVSP